MGNLANVTRTADKGGSTLDAGVSRGFEILRRTGPDFWRGGWCRHFLVGKGKRWYHVVFITKDMTSYNRNVLCSRVLIACLPNQSSFVYLCICSVSNFCLYLVFRRSTLQIALWSPHGESLVAGLKQLAPLSSYPLIPLPSTLRWPFPLVIVYLLLSIAFDLVNSQSWLEDGMMTTPGLHLSVI